MVNQHADPNAEQVGEAGAPPSAEDAYGAPGAGVVAAGMYFDHASGLTLPRGVQLANPGGVSSPTSMPSLFRPLRRAILSSFDKENLRTMAAVKKCAEAHPRG